MNKKDWVRSCQDSLRACLKAVAAAVYLIATAMDLGLRLSSLSFIFPFLFIGRGKKAFPLCKKYLQQGIQT